jgi:phage minor structural protein
MITIYNKSCNCLYPADDLFPSETLYPQDPLILNVDTFEYNGYGILRDFISNPIITEVLNGDYILEFEYAKSGWLQEYLIEENIIKAPNNGSDQLFRIYFTSKTLKGVRVLAKHVAFDLNDNFLEDVRPENLNAEDALNYVLERTNFVHGFTGWSDIETLATAYYIRRNFNDIFFNADNSFIKTWGGEFQFDNLTIKLYEHRGSDNGLSIRYGKNLTGINIDLDFSTVVTRIMPIGNNGLLLPELYVDSDYIDIYHSPVIKTLDVSVGEDEETTLEQAYEIMRETAQKEFTNGIDLPTTTARIDFIELSKVKEYEDYASLESVSLGDTIHVYVPQLNVDTNVRVTKTEYDCLKERFTKVELG